MKVSLLINMKMPTIVGIFIFISREHFISDELGMKKRFIILEQGLFSHLVVRLT